MSRQAFEPNSPDPFEHRGTCRFCGDEITWDDEYDFWQGETGRCPALPDDLLHLPLLSTATCEERAAVTKVEADA
jgi:hypothetical protein